MNKTALLICLGFCLQASAQSVEEKQWRAKSESALQNQLKTMIGNCKVPIDLSIDWSTWKSASDGKPYGTNAGNVCSGYLASLERFCAVSPYTHDKKSAEIAQEAVAKSIKKFVCKGDAADPKSPTFDLKDGVLSVHVAMESSSGNGKAIQDWLGKNL